MWILACRLTPTPKSKCPCILSDRIRHSVVVLLQLMDPVAVISRYYDFKRSAEKKEHKTMEAAGKVRKLFYLLFLLLRIIV